MNTTTVDQFILVGKNLMVLYLLISANFLASTLSCSAQRLFGENMLMKHMLGFFTLYFFVTLTETHSATPQSLSSKLGFSLVTYVWFLIASKMTPKLWIGTTLMLLIVFLLYLEIAEFERTKLTKTTDEQANIDKQIENMKTAQTVLVAFSIFTTLLGFLSYLGEKKAEYGRTFTYKTFIFGKPTCKGDEPGQRQLSFVESLKSAFKSS